MLIEDLHNISLDNLLGTNQISQRAHNCCGNEQLDTLYDILSYYQQHNTFLKIRNSGNKTSLELINLCVGTIKKLTDYGPTQLKSDTTNQLKIFDNLETIDLKQLGLLERQWEEMLEYCSVRVKNVLRKLTFDKYISSYLYTDRRQLLKLKNVGENSIKEIIDFQENYRSFIYDLMNQKICPSHYIYKEKLYRYGDICKNDFVRETIMKSNHLPILWILEQYFLNLQSKTAKVIFDVLPIFNDFTKLTLSDIGKKHNLTRERVRQIRNKGIYKLFEGKSNIVAIENRSYNVNISLLLNSKSEWEYLLNLFYNVEIACQDSSNVQRILKVEHSRLSGIIVLQIMSVIFKDKYILLGGYDKSSKGRFWKNTFLIKKEYAEIFDFGKIREDIENILTNNEHVYILNLEEYVSNTHCWIKYTFNKTKNIIKILRDILLFEFQLYSEDIGGHIKIPANKQKKTKDLVFEILKQNGDPMHLDGIFAKFKELYPEHKYKKAEQLRPGLQNHEAISYRNRKSVYTLKEWKHIRTGTIRSAIIAYLSKTDLPKTAANITKYVLQYFPQTNINSVRTSMLVDSQKRFTFFENNKFGLRNKKYPSRYKRIEHDVSRKSFEQKLLDMERFILKEGHFPFQSRGKSEEASLGLWWYRIVNNKQKLHNSQLEEVARVKLQYAEFDIDKKTHEWNLNYKKIKSILLHEKRLPYAQGDENLLHDWYIRAKEDFQSFKLSEQQRLKYIDLVKLI